MGDRSARPSTVAQPVRKHSILAELPGDVSGLADVARRPSSCQHRLVGSKRRLRRMLRRFQSHERVNRGLQRIKTVYMRYDMAAPNDNGSGGRHIEVIWYEKCTVPLQMFTAYIDERELLTVGGVLYPEFGHLCMPGLPQAKPKTEANNGLLVHLRAKAMVIANVLAQSC